uniref:SFRICE_041611 n=1 Tax=Spodoptera frugiperda TaxID=7108 RepID=A0A2H1W4K5_SPOFR
MTASPALGCESRCYHFAMRSRRSSSRHTLIWRGSGVSPRRRAAARKEKMRASTFASKSYGGNPARRLAAPPEIVRYPRITQMAMTLFDVSSARAGRCIRFGAWTWAP